MAIPTPQTAVGKAALEAILARPEKAVLALDFDGTLAPIVPDPEQARADPGAAPALAALAPRLAAAAIITGRPAEVAVRYGGFDGVEGLEHLTVLGQYGAERWDARTGEVHSPGPHEGVTAARTELPALLERLGPWEGTWIEEKGGRAVAVHTRRTNDPDGILEALRQPLADLAAKHGLVVEPGRYVLELRPPGIDKGVALEAFLREKGAESVLYAGDDLGDLAAFATVTRLRKEGVPGLCVAAAGTAEAPPELAAAADLTVPGPAGVVALLTSLAAAMS
jgi:trehalose 6-phosphate phosphatase